jgi:hypothetical protein
MPRIGILAYGSLIEDPDEVATGHILQWRISLALQAKACCGRRGES